MRRVWFGLCMAILVILLAAGCARQKRNTPVELRYFALDTMEGVITQSDVEIDKQISADGNGSLKIVASVPTVVRLFEIGDLDVENAKLLYQARVRTRDLAGKAYLEMWVHFPGKGEYYSRGLDRALTGTIEWVTEEIPFFLKKGENPDAIKLNLAIEGSGTVWIDAVRLFEAAP